ncbi:MAG TPA: hypothetical protein VJS89_05525 [Gammaproteobacteria bacterium]|nr:hypothetical protein [Gammaproteobacteria bacterium]
MAVTKTPPRSHVLDPFAGAGTTLIESKLGGHDSYGFEINPLLHFVCSTSLDWSTSASEINDLLHALGTKYSAEVKRAGEAKLEELGFVAPPIHNPFRWWRPDVLRDLLILRNGIDTVTQATPQVRAFLRLALAGVLVPDLTNVTLGRLQLHFIDRSADKIDVWQTFYAHACTMLEDLKAVAAVPSVGSATVFHVDATQPAIPQYLPPIDRVITSPPYPNRYSYVWNTRPHLYLLGFFDTPKHASELDLRTIGGTWGTATSVLQKGVIPYALRVMEPILAPVVDQIRKVDNLMANYLVKYFNLLVHQIRTQHPLLANNAQLAYVVGCSRLTDTYVETDVLLGRLFEALDLGYHVAAIERFRKRHSGKDLFESTVFVQRRTPS